MFPMFAGSTLIADYSKATLSPGWWEMGGDGPLPRSGAHPAAEDSSSASEEEGLSSKFWAQLAI